jgi:hypothetical protein
MGIDDQLDEDDVSEMITKLTQLIGYLRSEHRAIVDSAKIVRKKFTDTGRHNNLAFITFASLAGAEDFVNDK